MDQRKWLIERALKRALSETLRERKDPDPNWVAGEPVGQDELTKPIPTELVLGQKSEDSDG